MVAEGPEEPKNQIERDMRAKRTRKTILRNGDFEVELIPAGVDGHDGWKLKLPPGTTITHLPMPKAPPDNPCQT
jgi:hypothetical protein